MLGSIAMPLTNTSVLLATTVPYRLLLPQFVALVIIRKTPINLNVKLAQSAFTVEKMGEILPQPFPAPKDTTVHVVQPAVQTQQAHQ
jgi:hypothetical protein